ncbi:MAG: hypothetical protein OHK0039_06600 [Bacteroidia bacterium]
MLFLLPVLLWYPSLYAQLPPNQPEQDCFAALSVCQDIYVQPNSYSGEGLNPDEINGATSCFLLGEQNSVWYVFTVQTSGDLCFTIIPADTMDDYDWAVYNLTGRSCAAIATTPGMEVACNFVYNNGCEGRTGPNGLPGCPDLYEPCIPVQAGQTYVVNVSNFSATNSGYTLDFSPSTAQLFDDVPPEVTDIERHCEGATVTFSENVLCSTVQPGDFAFYGPGGTYTVSAVRSRNCDAGGDFDNTFDLVISPPFSQGGTYTVALTGHITDNCGNPAILSTGTVQIPPPPVASINTHAPQCEEGNSFGFGYPGPTAVTSFAWSFGDGNGSALAAPIHRYTSAGPMTVQLVIRDIYGCRDTATTQVDVLPGPLAAFDAPQALCQLDTFAPVNQTGIQGGAALTSFTWYLADGSRYDRYEIQHAFRQPGRYRVLLEAYNTLGCRDTFSRIIIVWPLPEVDFLTEADVCIGDTAHLLDLSSIRSDIDGDSIASWSWDFGDGDTAGAITAPAHLYDTAGVFPVTLRVVSDKGCVDSLVQGQIIHQPPPPEVVDTAVCWGRRAFLQAVPEPGGITHWYERSGDTLAFLLGPVHHTLPVAFADTFYAEVISEIGCVGPRVPVLARHHPIGQGQVLVSDTVLYFPAPTVQPQVEANVLLTQYSWDFGDRRLDSTAQPVHVYTHPGRYVLRLDGTDEHGCPHQWQRIVEVRQQVEVWVPSAFSPNGDGINDRLSIGWRDVQQFYLAVFNRQGQEVFATTLPDFGWDGRSPDGHPLPGGVYTYRVRAIDYTGNPYEAAGTITLIR